VRGLVLATVAGLLLAGAGAAYSAGEAKRPTLRILELAPVRIQGTNFKPGERVKLLINAGGPVAKSVRAGPRGGFTTRLDVSVRGCDGLVVQAIGGRGSRAMTDVTRPGCEERPD
jgi:hypothetical protein